MIEVIVNIPVDGEIEMDVKGAHGSACTKLTEEIEKELGNTKKKTRKPEYYQSQKTQTKLKQ